MTNAKDVKTKPVSIQLDRERTLLYDFNALIELEDIYGSVTEAMSGLEKLKVRNIRDMIWAGLLHEDENLTQKQVGKMLTMANLEEVALKISESLGISLPEPEGQPGKQPGE